MKQGHRVNKGWLWMAVYFLLLILGTNHVYGYSLLDSFLEIIGIGSWTREGQTRWHITSLIAIPLLLFCLYQTVRYMRGKYPRILLLMLVVSVIVSVVFPLITKEIVNGIEWIID
ncbi:hypothetical protein [Paenibacillus timonensis]|uniref:hypothetical protein n=1 Tax=Paenibacillus timonensis TaxID=225915 RepID=UPI003F964D9B